jgi:hypothetical protein
VVTTLLCIHRNRPPVHRELSGKSSVGLNGTLDLWAATLPEFDVEILNAKYAVLSGQPQTPEQIAAWNAVVEIANHFKSADKILLSLPM